MNLGKQYKIFFLTIFYILFQFLAYSQNSPISTDSIIKKEIKKASDYLSTNPDTALIIAKHAYLASRQLNNKTVESYALYQLGIIYKTIRKFDKAIYYHVESLKIRRKLNDNTEIARSLNALGNTFYDRGNLSRSLIFFKHSYAIKCLNKDEKGAAVTLFNIGNIYLDLSQYDTALTNFTLSLNKFEKLEYLPGKASCYNSIGIIYEILENYEKALSYYQQSLDIETKTENYPGMINAFNNIGNIYSIGGMQQNALTFYQSALKYSEILGDTENIANALKNIGIIYTFRNDFKLANSNFLKAERLSKKVGRLELEINICHAIGYSYTLQGKCDSAIYYLKKSLDNSINIGYSNMIANNYIMLAHASMSNGEETQAFDYYQKYNHENDKNINELNKTRLQLTNFKEISRINLEQSRDKILQLKIKSDKIYFLFIFIVIVLLSIVIFLYLRKKNLSLRYKNLELQQKFLQVQMNPHFIHNTLASIEGHLYNNNPTETAVFISDFSHLIRNILESSRKDYISLQNELEMLKQYVNLQKLRFGDMFTCSFNIDENIDQESVCIPPMMIQPFIENCIEHAFPNVSHSGLIKVSIKQSENVLSVEICDNGIGISNSHESRQKKSDFNSLSHKIITERLTSLSNKKTKCNIKIENFPQLPNNTGTKVILTLPFKLLHQL